MGGGAQFAGLASIRCEPGKEPGGDRCLDGYAIAVPAYLGGLKQVFQPAVGGVVAERSGESAGHRDQGLEGAGLALGRLRGRSDLFDFELHGACQG